MRLNFERGFRRITWVVSVAVLVTGAFLIVPDWWSALILWNQAEEPPSGEVAVYVRDVGVFVTFPKDFPEAQIKDVLDRKAQQLASDKAQEKKIPPDLSKFSDDELINLARSKGIHVQPRQPLPRTLENDLGPRPNRSMTVD